MEPIKQKGFHKLPEPVKGAVITVSDRCYAGTREDASGPLAAKLLADYDVIVDEVKLIPDGIEEVTQALREAIAAGARVILTTGGTGVTPRDLTPEGTAPLLAVRLDGLAEQVRAYGLAKTPLASLSRGLANQVIGQVVRSRSARARLTLMSRSSWPPGATASRSFSVRYSPTSSCLYPSW